MSGYDRTTKFAPMKIKILKKTKIIKDFTIWGFFLSKSKESITEVIKNNAWPVLGASTIQNIFKQSPKKLKKLVLPCINLEVKNEAFNKKIAL